MRRKITPRTKAIIAVHYTGQPCEMDEIHAIAEEYHLLVIEDAAHALGAEYHGKKIGSVSDMTTFSFHPVKPITCDSRGVYTPEYNVRLHEFRLPAFFRIPFCVFRMESESRTDASCFCSPLFVRGRRYYQLQDHMQEFVIETLKKTLK